MKHPLACSLLLIVVTGQNALPQDDRADSLGEQIIDTVQG